MAPPGRRNKAKLGRGIPQGERRLVNSISKGITATAQGAETAVIGFESAPAAAAPQRAEDVVRETRAAQEGAKTLFELKEDGFVSALAIMLVPRVLKEGSRRVAAVAQPFGFVCKIAGRERLAVVVPAGYVTDFASIPRAVHFIISPFGKHAEAAVIHDWLYALGTPKDRKGRRVADTRAPRGARGVTGPAGQGPASGDDQETATSMLVVVFDRRERMRFVRGSVKRRSLDHRESSNASRSDVLPGGMRRRRGRATSTSRQTD